ncbi:MAG: flippase activity-associated protein Agl23 [Anaerolineae bacterium]
MQEGTSESIPEPELQQFGPPWLTVETGLYILLLLVAAALRFAALGRQPLQEQEARLALDAWRFYSGGAASIRGYSPLLFHGNVLLYLLFEASDYVARVMQALAGTLMVGVPYLLRPRLGRKGALFASAFLTFSPSLIFFSRQLNGEIIAAAACLALVAGVFGYASQGRSWQLYLAAAALAVAVLASGATYATLVVLAGFFLVAIARSRYRSEGESSPWAVLFAEKPRSGVLLTALGVFAALVALLSTGLLVNLQGLQAALDLPSLWLSQFQPAVDGQPWHYYLLLLLAYELPVLIFGLAGACYLSRRDPFAIFLVCWFIFSLVLYSLMGSKPAAGILQMIVPLTLLAGRCVGDLLNQLERREQWLWAMLTLAISVPALFHLLLQAAAFGNPGNPGDPRHLALVLLSVFFVLCVISIVGVLSLDWRVSLRSGALVLLVGLASLSVHTAWRLNYHRPGNPLEILVEKPTSSDVRNLAQAIEDFSNQQERQRDSVSIAVTGEEDPLLAWYLRSFPHLSFVSAAMTSPTPVVVTPQEETPYLPDYRGARFRLQSSWKAMGLPGHDLVNWFLFRDSLQPPVHRDVVMWVAPDSEE